MTTFDLLSSTVFSVLFGFPLSDIFDVTLLAKTAIYALLFILLIVVSFPFVILLLNVLFFICSKLHILWIVMYPIWTIYTSIRMLKNDIYWPVARLFLSQPVPGGVEVDLPDAAAPKPKMATKSTENTQSFLQDNPKYYDPILGEYYNQVLPLDETELFTQASKWAASHDFVSLGSFSSSAKACRQ